MGLDLGGGAVFGGDILVDGPVDPLPTLKLWCIGDHYMEGDILHQGGYALKWSGSIRNAMYLASVAATYGWEFVGSANSYAAPSGLEPAGWFGTLPMAQAYWDGEGLIGGGDSVDAWQGVRSAKFQSWGLAQAGLYNLAVIMIGGLDIIHAYDDDVGGDPGATDGTYHVEDLTGRILMLAKLAHENGGNCPVVVVTIPPIEDKVAAVDYHNALLIAACADFPWIIVSDVNPLITLATHVGDDGFNLTAAGHQIVGNKIYQDIFDGYVIAAGWTGAPF